MIRINGTETDCSGMSVSEYLASAGYDVKRVAIQKNGEIVPKSQYDAVLMQDGDVVEVVSFVGGG